MELTEMVKKVSRALCKLDDGTITDYDAAANPNQRPYNNQFEYIGNGVVYAIAGIIQPGYNRMSFFKLKNIKKRRKNYILNEVNKT